jgi:glyoxylase-like metal-dependent hydrolase (beta-lactamase superfamily II)
VTATTARIEKVVTSGKFALDGGEWQVENNVWLIGDDREVLVVDAAHDAEKILAAIGDRRVVAIVCTHGHNDHINAAVEVAAATDAEIALHPADRMLWAMEYGEDLHPDIDLGEADPYPVAGTTLAVLHTPGHTPGSVCLYAPELGGVFSGDTLFQGGPGATGRSYSSFDTIIDSIRSTLLTLPPDTTVRTGHGDSTSIGAEAQHLEEWIAKGS